MATSFTTICDFVRTILGDTDPVIQQYPDSVINSHIRLLILQTGDPNYQEDGDTAVFTTDLPQQVIAKTVYKVVRGILAPQHDHYAYKTAVLSVLRKGGVQQLMNHIDKQIAALEGGLFAVSSDDFATALVNGTMRFIDNISTSFAGP